MRGIRAAWRLETPLPDELREQLTGQSVMLAHLLWCRGYRTLDEIISFFAETTISHDPFLLPDMEAAVQRIARALSSGERIAVYGDFDCDGITAAAVLLGTLRGYGVEPVVHIPTRADGHGLQPEALADLRDRGVDLIVTADCGISAIEEVRVAQGMGMDVIITDHHEVRADLIMPECPAVSPTRYDSEFPCRFLCGVGVAYKLAQALAARVPGGGDPDDLLDLVALGTIADVVALRDENRSLVIRGLRRLQVTRRPGLLALFEAAQVEPEKIDPVSVGFYLAPRINAANRMATPQLAYDLITATDQATAAPLAEQLSTYNHQRQALVAEHLERLLIEVGDPEVVASEVAAGVRPPLLLVMGEWSAGISGLLASKLVDRYGMPAFVGSGLGTGTIAVSARGVPGSRIDELLEAAEAAHPSGLFYNYGGHSAAGGFRAAEEKLDLVRSTLDEESRRRISLDELGAVLRIDAEVRFAQLSIDAARLVRSLAPFGMGFSEPLFLARDVTLQRLTPTRDGRHMRLSLRQGGVFLEGICFNCPPELGQIPPGSRVDAVFHLQVNEWQGRLKPEIQVRDWRVVA